MREILFRGQTQEGNWRQGLLVEINDDEHGHRWAIIPSGVESYRFNMSGDYVNPSTIGQYTGLTDRKGNRIYEGDIVKWDGTEISQIRYCDGVYRLCNAEGYYGVSVHNHYSYVEVIGNIHDNPELLKGGE